MPSSETKTIQFRSNDGENSAEATLYTLVFEQNELTKRALARLGLCWLASVGSIPIIFAHWVLVPGFFIAGPIMAAAAYKMKTMPEKAEGRCPVCNESITIDLEAKDVLPKWTYCPNCNHSIQLAE